jgi:hypothetical protein
MREMTVNAFLVDFDRMPAEDRLVAGSAARGYCGFRRAAG